ncbi:MAG: hypothetical protein ACRBFS_21325 [Aureispira sp.]
MENGFWWNIGWKEQEYFEIGEGYFQPNQHLDENQVKSWNSTARWKESLTSKLTHFQVTYVDETEFIPWKIKIELESGSH